LSLPQPHPHALHPCSQWCIEAEETLMQLGPTANMPCSATLLAWLLSSS
jgi:hypothetical protein